MYNKIPVKKVASVIGNPLFKPFFETTHFITNGVIEPFMRIRGDFFHRNHNNIGYILAVV
jgi:hypothetical protein